MEFKHTETLNGQTSPLSIAEVFGHSGRNGMVIRFISRNVILLGCINWEPQNNLEKDWILCAREL